MSGHASEKVAHGTWATCVRCGAPISPPTPTAVCKSCDVSSEDSVVGRADPREATDKAGNRVSGDVPPAPSGAAARLVSERSWPEGYVPRSETVARLGARLGNWNDRTFGRHDTRADASWLWRRLDRIAAWMHVRGDR